MSITQTLWQRLKFWITDTGKQFIIAIAIVLVLRSSFVEPYKIPSGSMIPTLFIGDHIFVNKFAYGLKVPLTEYFLDRPISVTTPTVPARGDVIVFRYPRDESINYIKRVVGLPGDLLALRDKVLYINNNPVERTNLKDDYLLEGIENNDDRQILQLFEENLTGIKHPVLQDGKSLLSSDYGPIEVPKDKIFVMGDNRDRSSDSRIWGFVPLENVKGKAMFIWLNLLFGGEQLIKFRFDRIARLIH
jgi:signal peptidase I